MSYSPSRKSLQAGIHLLQTTSRIVRRYWMTPPLARCFVKVISESPETECAILPSNLIEYWLKCAAENFPKTAAGLPEAEIQYQKSLQEYRSTIFIPKWLDQYQASGLANQMGRVLFGRLGELLHIILFTEWSHSAIDDGRLAVSFPEKNLVGKYAKNVVYYVA